MRYSPILLGVLILFLFATPTLAIYNYIDAFNFSTGSSSNILFDMDVNNSHIAILLSNAPNFKIIDPVTHASVFNCNTDPVYMGYSFALTSVNNDTGRLIWTRIGNAHTAHLLNTSCLLNYFQGSWFDYYDKFVEFPPSEYNSTNQLLFTTVNNKAYVFGNNSIPYPYVNVSTITGMTGTLRDYSNEIIYTKISDIDVLFDFTYNIYNYTSSNQIGTININDTYGVIGPDKNLISTFNNNTATKKLAWIAEQPTGADYITFMLVDLQTAVSGGNSSITAFYPAMNDRIYTNAVTLNAKVISNYSGNILFYLDGVNVGNKSYNFTTDVYYAVGGLSQNNHTWSASFITSSNTTFNSNINYFFIETSYPNLIANSIATSLSISITASQNLLALLISLIFMVLVSAYLGIKHVHHGFVLGIITFLVLILIFTLGLAWLPVWLTTILIILFGGIMFGMITGKIGG